MCLGIGVGEGRGRRGSERDMVVSVIVVGEGFVRVEAFELGAGVGGGRGGEREVVEKEGEEGEKGKEVAEGFGSSWKEDGGEGCKPVGG